MKKESIRKKKSRYYKPKITVKYLYSQFRFPPGENLEENPFLLAAAEYLDEY
ncbi:MAG: hypothetical protein ACD_7C00182G0005 [uncultured bacterium]|nr:MAG: hypothetical protein ACD_7C00182G0005 [uncultured bacterium]